MPKESDSVHHHPRKFLRRLYGPLSLLKTLGPVRGSHIKQDYEFDTHDASPMKLRRSLADAIAYICAYDKRPDTITAVALEKKPSGVVVWIAANSNVKPHVLQFIESNLNAAIDLSQNRDLYSSVQSRQQKEQEILSKVIDFSQKRIITYIKLVKKILHEGCLEHLSCLADGSVKIMELKSWLISLFGLPFDHASEIDQIDCQVIVRECHRNRNDGHLKTIEMIDTKGQIMSEKFQRLCKLLYKLGKHVTICRKIVQALTKLPQDFNEGFVIKSLPASSVRDLPFKWQDTTVENIAGRVFSNFVEKELFLNRLREIWDLEQLTKSTREVLNEANGTRVHAELLLLNHFEKNGGTFLGRQDKYIGCSKPSCLLCYSYICHHPGGYSKPRCHQKLYTIWRAPDICKNSLNAERMFNEQRKTLEKVIADVRNDLKKEIQNRGPRFPYHEDSTIGKTSTELHSVLFGTEEDFNSHNKVDSGNELDDHDYCSLLNPIPTQSSDEHEISMNDSTLSALLSRKQNWETNENFGIHNLDISEDSDEECGGVSLD